MFYSNNNDYMQDLYFYNQNPVQRNDFNPYMNNINPVMQNPNMMNNMGNMNIGQNPNSFARNQPTNLNTLFPNTYRIIQPVATKVIANTNSQFMNEDILNNMVDTVYNIVDGDIKYEENLNTMNKQENTSSINSNSNNNSASANKVTDTRQTTTQTTVTTQRNTSRPDSLLKDIIKIIILKELLSRNQFTQNPSQNFIGQPFYNTQMCNW